MVFTTFAEHSLRREIMDGHHGRIHGGEVDLCHVLKDPEPGLKDEAPLVCDEQIPRRLEPLRFPFSPRDENSFLEGPVELHRRDGRPGRGTGHPLNRDLRHSGQLDHSFHPRFSIEEGVSTIDMPSPEEEMGRSLIVGSAIGEVRITLGARLSLHGIRLPIPRDRGLPPLLCQKEKGQKRGISVIAQDHIRIELFHKPGDLSDIHILHLHPIPFAFHGKRAPSLLSRRQANRVSVRANLHDPKIRKVSVIDPDRFGRIGANLKDAISLTLTDASACRKEAFFIKVGLG